MSFFKIDVVEVPYHVIKQEKQMSIQLTPKDFGGTFLNPKFIYNPVFAIDMIKPMSCQIKLEFSNTQVSSMICLIGVDTDLQDIREANYNYFLRQANPGHHSLGVSELNCYLDVGRYLLICSLQNNQPVNSTMKVVVNSYHNKLSDHPQVFERAENQPEEIFSIQRLEMKSSDVRFPFKQIYTDAWLPGRGEGMKKLYTNSYSAFHTNPGVIIYVNEEVTLRFHLYSKGYSEHYTNVIAKGEIDQEPPSLGVYVMKINNVNDLQPILDDADLTSAAWGCWTRYICNNLAILLWRQIRKDTWYYVYHQLTQLMMNLSSKFFQLLKLS